MGRKLEDVLKTLPSYDLYKGFYEDVEAGKKGYYENYCEAVKKKAYGNEWVNDFCTKFVRNLKQVNSEADAGKKNRCLLLNYWIFHEIWKNRRNKKDNPYNIPVFNEIREVGERINRESSAYHCYCYFYGILDDWRKEKELHDYFKNFNHIKKKFSFYNEDCNLYSQYVTEMNDIYFEKESDCCIWAEDNCYKYFDCDKEKRPYILLSYLKCYDKSLVEPPDNVVQEEKPPKLQLDNSIIIKHGRCIYTKDDRGNELGYKCIIPEYQVRPQEGETVNRGEQKADLGQHVRVVDLTTHQEVTDIKVEPKVKQVEEAEAEAKAEEVEENAESSEQEEPVSLFAEVVPTVRKEYASERKDTCLPNQIKDQWGLCKTIDEKRENEVLKEVVNTKKSDLERGVITTFDNDFPYFNSEHEMNLLDDGFSRIASRTGLTVAASLMFFLFYKFTPLGHVFGRKKFDRRKNMYYLQEGYGHELLRNASQYGDANLLNGGAGLVYQPVYNTWH
ncbi:Plasmodium vivax Vir protein, putative [Plasmodium vivax]|uniref:Vir protein, putative n=1 Tax=Plasmodium vivax TaxID=5855 RepID=A0A1G4GVT3_PLAVI|nr:Plasmodium vivax Vir protein, putative [Plasmodium vivax]